MEKRCGWWAVRTLRGSKKPSCRAGAAPILRGRAGGSPHPCGFLLVEDTLMFGGKLLIPFRLEEELGLARLNEFAGVPWVELTAPQARDEDEDDDVDDEDDDEDEDDLDDEDLDDDLDDEDFDEDDFEDDDFDEDEFEDDDFDDSDFDEEDEDDEDEEDEDDEDV
jgi:hypothetical protein